MQWIFAAAAHSLLSLPILLKMDRSKWTSEYFEAYSYIGMILVQIVTISGEVMLLYQIYRP
jgi:hypothetical protein